MVVEKISFQAEKFPENELNALSVLGVATMELKYKTSKRTDEFGNKFRYRAKVLEVRGAQVGRWARDVFPLSQQL